MCMTADRNVRNGPGQRARWRRRHCLGAGQRKWEQPWQQRSWQRGLGWRRWRGRGAAVGDERNVSSRRGHWPAALLARSLAIMPKPWAVAAGEHCLPRIDAKPKRRLRGLFWTGTSTQSARMRACLEGHGRGAGEANMTVAECSQVSALTAALLARNGGCGLPPPPRGGGRGGVLALASGGLARDASPSPCARAAGGPSGRRRRACVCVCVDERARQAATCMCERESRGGWVHACMPAVWTSFKRRWADMGGRGER